MKCQVNSNSAHKVLISKETRERYKLRKKTCGNFQIKEWNVENYSLFLKFWELIWATLEKLNLILENVQLFFLNLYCYPSYKSYKEICRGEQRKVNLGYVANFKAFAVVNNTLVHVPRSVYPKKGNYIQTLLTLVQGFKWAKMPPTLRQIIGALMP